MIEQRNDIIAAIATPVGIGGISVIRMSGPQAATRLDRLFKGNTHLNDVQPYTIHYGEIITIDGSVLDTALVSVFHQPHSYTGEDVCEISCHGGYYVAQAILSELYKIGIRPAEPGEFTLRAFLNGKMDLTQAEAVADLIHSKSEKSHKTSIEQLEGRLSKYTENLRQAIIDICSLFELELDFSQEGIEITDKKIALEKLSSIKTKIESLIATYSSGKRIREGVKVAVVGKPNAGKSSLMNILLEEERAIVSHIPGTTRDTIEETIIIDGMEFVFTDTAGLRESGDVIEQEGIKRTSAKVQNSDIVCLVVDSSEPIASSDLEMYNKVQSILPQSALKIYIYNKNDIKSPKFDKSAQKIKFKNVSISCKNGDGIDKLKKMLKDSALPQFDSTESSVVINNIRHKNALENALNGITISMESLKNGMSDEFIAVDLRRAVDYLGEIIGITTPDDILNNIFSKFCIGK